MQCDCQAEIEKKLLERFKSEYPNSKKHECDLSGYAMVLGETLDYRPAMTIILRHTVTAKSGAEREKKIEHKMIGDYCMFCGKPAKPQQTEV